MLNLNLKFKAILLNINNIYNFLKSFLNLSRFCMRRRSMTCSKNSELYAIDDYDGGDSDDVDYDGDYDDDEDEDVYCLSRTENAY